MDGNGKVTFQEVKERLTTAEARSSALAYCKEMNAKLGQPMSEQEPLPLCVAVLEVHSTW